MKPEEFAALAEEIWQRGAVNARYILSVLVQHMESEECPETLKVTEDPAFRLMLARLAQLARVDARGGCVGDDLVSNETGDVLDVVKRRAQAWRLRR